MSGNIKYGDIRSGMKVWFLGRENLQKAVVRYKVHNRIGLYIFGDPLWDITWCESESLIFRGWTLRARLRFFLMGTK